MKASDHIRTAEGWLDEATRYEITVVDQQIALANAHATLALALMVDSLDDAVREHPVP